MRACSGGLRSLGAAATLVVALQAPACASDWVAEAGRLRHRELDLSLADPAAQGGWTRIEVEGARLAFRGPDGATMSFLRDCEERREGSPRLAARQLLLGLETRRLREDRAVEVAGAPGWLQVVEARDEDRAARLKTVTRLDGGCREDWVLATPGPPGEAEAGFDAWWRSYRPPGRPGAAAADAPPSDGESGS